MRALSNTLLLGLCIGLAPSMYAAVDFSTGGAACGSSFCSSGGGVNVTATGLSATFTNVTSSTFAVGTLSATGTSITQYSGNGLGVCDPSDSGCGAPEHAIDNNGGRVDFVLLQLSVPMSSISLTLNPFGTQNDMDITVITGLCTATCNSNLLTAAGVIGKTPFTDLANVNLATFQGISGASNVSMHNYSDPGTGGQNINLIVPLAATSGAVNWILVGASTQKYYGDSSSCTTPGSAGTGALCTPDYFKLNALSGSSVPEPATFGMAGAALAALGLLKRRKRLSANS